MDSNVKNKIQKLEDRIDEFYETYIIYRTNKYKIIDKQNKRTKELNEKIETLEDCNWTNHNRFNCLEDKVNELENKIKAMAKGNMCQVLECRIGELEDKIKENK